MLDVKSAKRVPKCSNTGSTTKKTIVIGGGAGGFGTVEALRSYGYTGQIELISRENYLPIDRLQAKVLECYRPNCKLPIRQ